MIYSMRKFLWSLVVGQSLIFYAWYFRFVVCASALVYFRNLKQICGSRLRNSKWIVQNLFHYAWPRMSIYYRLLLYYTFIWQYQKCYVEVSLAWTRNCFLMANYLEYEMLLEITNLMNRNIYAVETCSEFYMGWSLKMFQVAVKFSIGMTKDCYYKILF